MGSEAEMTTPMEDGLREHLRENHFIRQSDRKEVDGFFLRPVKFQTEATRKLSEQAETEGQDEEDDPNPDMPFNDVLEPIKRAEE